MKALLVIDVQNGIVDFGGGYPELLSRIEQIIHDFKRQDLPILFIRHLDDMEESPLYRGSKGSEIHPTLQPYVEKVIEKQTPSAFYQTELAGTLEKLGVNHLFITGFNTEFCCMFTSIAAYDRGYQVTFIEDATGTGNNADTYEMPGLDIRDFIGTVLHWSEAIEVLDYEEYVESYKEKLT